MAKQRSQTPITPKLQPATANKPRTKATLLRYRDNSTRCKLLRIAFLNPPSTADPARRLRVQALSGFPAPAAIASRHHRRASFPPAGPRGRRDTQRPLPWRRKGTMRGPVWPRNRPTSLLGGGGQDGMDGRRGEAGSQGNPGPGGWRGRQLRETRPRGRAPPKGHRPLRSAPFPEGRTLQPSSGPRGAAGLQASGNPPPAGAAAREQSQD